MRVGGSTGQNSFPGASVLANIRLSCFQGCSSASTLSCNFSYGLVLLKKLAQIDTIRICVYNNIEGLL